MTVETRSDPSSCEYGSNSLRAFGRKRAGVLASCILLAMAGGFSAQAQNLTDVVDLAERVPQSVTTRHTGRFNGQELAYSAIVAEYYGQDEDERDGAAVVTIAYVREGQPAAHRPVMFAFNGGPGASSSPLHLSALGPVRRTPQDGQGWSDNPFSPLDEFDLVFIDPVGTGFSRPFSGVDAKSWFSQSSDAAAAASVIERWLAANGREASPIYLTGESYGTVRAATILKERPDLSFDGLVLIGLVGRPEGNEMPYVVTFPTMAAAAWHHRRIERTASLRQTFDAALEFARTEYVSALIKGDSLSSAERREMAVKMSAFIGLPAELIEARNLRLSKNDLMFNLLKTDGLRTGSLDVRVTGPLEPGQLGGIDDPALGVVPSRGAGTPATPPTPQSVGPIANPVLKRYLNEELKFQSAEPYYGLNLAVNGAWDNSRSFDANSAIGDALARNSAMRVFWAAGLYDLSTPVYLGRYTLDHAGVPTDRLTAVYFEGPHGVYEGEENLEAFNRALREFVHAGRR